MMDIVSKVCKHLTYYLRHQVQELYVQILLLRDPLVRFIELPLNHKLLPGRIPVKWLVIIMLFILIVGL